MEDEETLGEGVEDAVERGVGGGEILGGYEGGGGSEGLFLPTGGLPAGGLPEGPTGLPFFWPACLEGTILGTGLPSDPFEGRRGKLGVVLGGGPTGEGVEDMVEGLETVVGLGRWKGWKGEGESECEKREKKSESNSE